MFGKQLATRLIRIGRGDYQKYYAGAFGDNPVIRHCRFFSQHPVPLNDNIPNVLVDSCNKKDDDDDPLDPLDPLDPATSTKFNSRTKDSKDTSSSYLKDYALIMDYLVNPSLKLEKQTLLRVIDPRNPPLSKEDITKLIMAADMNDYPDVIVRIYKQMVLWGIELHPTTYEMILDACKKVEELEVTVEILTFLFQCDDEVDRDMEAYHHAMYLCVGRNQWLTALNLLDQIKNLDLIPSTEAYQFCTWACSESGEWCAALELVEEMIRLNVPRSTLVYQSATRACKAAGRYSEALTLLKYMKQDKIIPCQQTYENCIDVLGEGKQWEKALDLFRSVDPSNLTVSLYSVMLHALAKSAKWQEAMDLFLEMQRINPLEPDVQCCNFVILACEASGRYEELQWMLSYMKDQLHLVPNVYTYGHAIGVCAKAKKLSKALQFLEEVKQHEEFETSPVALKQMVYNNAILACKESGNWKLAMNLVEEAARVVHLTSATYAHVISTCSKNGQWKRAIDLFHKIPMQTIEPNSYVFSSAMSAYNQGSCYHQALTLFDLAKNRGIEMDLALYNSAISACAGARKWNLAEEIFTEMKRHCVPDSFTYSSLIQAYSRGSKFEKCLDVLSLYANSKPREQLSSYPFNAAISAISAAREWKVALRIFDSMEKYRVQRDTISYSAAINACAIGGQWGRAMELLEEMKDYEIEINTRVYNAAIRSCKMEKKIKEALQLFHSMEEKDHMTYASLIHVLNYCGEYEQAIHFYLEREKNKTLFPKVTEKEELCVLGPTAFAYYQLDRIEESIQLFMRMKHSSRKEYPNVHTHHTVFKALAKQENSTDLALELLESMIAKKVRPNYTIYLLLMQLCQREKRWKDILQLEKQVQKDQLSIDEDMQKYIQLASRHLHEEN